MKNYNLGRINKYLIIGLLVQVLLIAYGSYQNKLVASGGQTTLAFADFDPKDVTGVKLTLPPEEEFELKRVENGWILPVLSDIQAEQKKTTELVKELSSLKVISKAGNTKVAAKKFATAEDNFEAKITINTEGGEKSIFIGKVPTYKQAYARPEGEDATYVVNFQKFSLGEGAKSWFAKDLLKLPADQIDSIELEQVVFKRNKENWELASKQAELQAISAEVKELANKLAALSYTDLPALKSEESAKKILAPEPVSELNYQKSLKLTFFKHSESFYLSRSDLDYLFKISESNFKYFTALKVDEFVKTVNQVQEEVSEEQSETTASDPAVEKLSGQPVAP